MNTKQQIRPPVEVRYAKELEALKANDQAVKPVNWQLSPQAVRKFILGSREPVSFQGEEITIKKKYMITY